MEALLASHKYPIDKQCITKGCYKGFKLQKDINPLCLSVLFCFVNTQNLALDYLMLKNLDIIYFLDNNLFFLITCDFFFSSPFQFFVPGIRFSTHHHGYFRWCPSPHSFLISVSLRSGRRSLSGRKAFFQNHVCVPSEIATQDFNITSFKQ